MAWNQHLAEHADAVFGAGKKAAGPTLQDMPAKIGQLALDKDFLFVALGRINHASANDPPVRKCDPSRLITSRASCRGVAGEDGKLEAVALAGKIRRALHLEHTMLDYRHSVRPNDIAKGTCVVARKFTRMQSESLATRHADLLAVRATRKQARPNRTRRSINFRKYLFKH